MSLALPSPESTFTILIASVLEKGDLTVSNPILDVLNESQRRAVTTIDGPVLVLAGPGSGKTRVLTHRIAHMIQGCGINPWNIMAVTFTNKAANEMRERLARIVGEQVKDVRLGTFHAICAWMLRREVEATPYKAGFAIYDTSDQQALIKNILTEMQKDPKQHRPGAILGAISAAKNELLAPEDYPGSSYREEITREVYRRYLKKLQVNNALDFDDLLMQAVLLLRQHLDIREKYHGYFHYLLIDEFQDTNMAQYELMRLLGLRHQNIFVVGDPDQSIYAFRGADYRNVQRFQMDYPDRTVITLDENYRSHQFILDAAMAVIRKDPAHIKRDLFSARSSGALIEIHELHHERAEGDFVVDQIQRLQREEGYTPRDFAIMYRTNAQSRVLEESFVNANMPYRIVGSVRFYERMEIKDLLAYVRLIANRDDTISLARVLNTPPRGIGKKSIETLTLWIDKRRIGQWAALQEIRKGKENLLPARAAKSIIGFVELLEKWIGMQDAAPLELLDTIIEDIQYQTYLENQPDERSEDRIDNVNELRRIMAGYEGYALQEVLNEISLVADIDSLDESKDAPTLLTLHSAKGLEFPVVFIVGLEEGLLPHERSMQERDQMGEERRLMYVGLTRAKDRLYLSHVTTRSNYYGADYRDPSRFLEDMPSEITLRKSPWQMRTPSPASRSRLNHWAVTPKTEPDRPARTPIFKAGTKVSHRIFGQGVVIKSQMDSDIEEVIVEFEKHGQKKLDGSFLTVV